MSKISADQITIPSNVTSVAVEVWEEGSRDVGIIWDRTRCEPDDGQWGDQMIDWEGDRRVVVIALEEAGFEVGEFVTYDLEGGPEELATATR